MNRRVLIERDPTSSTGWTGTWLSEQDGRVQVETSADVDPHVVVDRFEDNWVEEFTEARFGERALRARRTFCAARLFGSRR